MNDFRSEFFGSNNSSWMLNSILKGRWQEADKALPIRMKAMIPIIEFMVMHIQFHRGQDYW